MGRKLGNLLASIFSGDRSLEASRKLEASKSSAPAFVELDARLGAGRFPIAYAAARPISPTAVEQ